MPLRTTKLGTTPFEITPVGFGAWAIGGAGWRFGWGAQDDDESVAAILAAVERGVSWIDTAAVYGLGHSEEIVRRALAALPEADRPAVFTKCGLVWNPADPGREPQRVMEPDNVRRELDSSLQRLGVERIDLYQVHWPPDPMPGSDGAPARPATPIEEYWGVMASLRDAGKVAAIGLSNHDATLLDRAERVAHVDAIQPPFSLVARGAADDIAWAAAHDTGVIVYSPLQSGLLTGAFSRERAASLPEDDWRRTSPDFTTGLDPILAFVDALRPMADRRGVPVASLAVAWTLAWPGVTGAIVGARRPDQIDGWLPAASLDLTDAELDEIASLLDRLGVGSGPTRP
jgi:aryl-alcohol dehydrogenase-like predicted oxidoreductase